MLTITNPGHCAVLSLLRGTGTPVQLAEARDRFRRIFRDNRSRADATFESLLGTLPEGLAIIRDDMIELTDAARTAKLHPLGE